VLRLVEVLSLATDGHAPLVHFCLGVGCWFIRKIICLLWLMIRINVLTEYAILEMLLLRSLRLVNLASGIGIDIDVLRLLSQVHHLALVLKPHGLTGVNSLI